MRLRLFTALLTIVMAGNSAAEVPVVVTDIPPIQSLVASVMGDLGEPVLLTTSTADPHHIQLRPSQARALSDADLVFWVAAELTPWLEHGLQTLAGDAVVTALLQSPGTRIRYFADDTAALDAHAWLDPENARIWLANIASVLSSADPDNRDTYRRNAAVTGAEIDQLQLFVSETLDPAQGKQLIFAHDGFGYFSDRFNLNAVGVIADGNANTPGAAHLRVIKALLRSGSIACIVSEPRQNPAILHTLIDDFPIPVVELDPIGSNLDVGKQLYRDLILNIAVGIADCVNASD